MRKINLFILLAFFSAIINAHPWKSKHYVIIDTDCGIDDFRAISMLLASPSVRVLAITTSNGVLNSKEGYFKVKSLLNQYHHEGILAGANLNPEIKAKNCQTASDFKWGKKTEPGNIIPSHIEIINQVLANSDEKLTFISLGSLSTVSSCYAGCPEFSERLKQIVWSADYETLPESFNYILAPKAYIAVEAGNLPLSIVNGNIYGLIYDADILNEIDKIQTPYSKQFYRSITETKSPFSNFWYDEIAVIYLHHPELFRTDTISTGLFNCYITTLQGVSHLEHEFVEILSGIAVSPNQVLSKFTLDTSDYRPDIQPIAESALLKYGREEWVSCVMANELHRHLGVYAIIGSKMGIRAKEYFGAGIDELKIMSYAGANPPLSCMNDGLQVSTGATLGHGLISVAADSLKLLKADFVYMNREITISIKEAYRKEIVSEVREFRLLYGLDSDIYWELVRKLAIKCWSTLDRHNIFDIEEK